jgi:DnaJ family protein C protein 8
MLPCDWRLRVLKETRNILIDEEVQRRRAIKNTLANEGLEAKRQEEEIQERKRKMDEKKTWEGA